MALDIFVTLLLVFMNGFFVAAEFAIVKVRSSQIETKTGVNAKISGVAKTILGHLDAYLAATQLGITLASLGLGWIGEGVVASILLKMFSGLNLSLTESTAHTIALPVAFAIITILHIVFGELAPKSLAIRHPLKTTFSVALPLRIFYFTFRPFIYVLNGLANFLLKLIGIRPIHGSETHTEEELKVIIQESAESGAIEEIEQNIVDRVFSLGDRKAGELMTHRVDLVWLDIKDDLKTIRKKVQEEIHSVYPVADGQIDNLVGIFSVKDGFALELNNQTFKLEDHLTKPLIIVENTPAFKILEIFKDNKSHYGIVVDEYGSIKGMVVMNDVVDALLGEVSEYNQEEYHIMKRDEHTWLADAQIPYFVFCEHFDLNSREIADRGFNTLAGLILNKLQHIPVEGEKVQWNNFEFEVIDIDGTRIDKILIRKI